MSEIIYNPKTCNLRGRRHFLPPSCQWICLSPHFKHKLSFNMTSITHFHSSSAYFIDKQYLLLHWSVMMVKNKDRKAKLLSAYHEFPIHCRLFWLVSFLRFAIIPCCDSLHVELSWRQSWVDNLNLEVIQQLYILTASFAPEHMINIQWNTKLSARPPPSPVFPCFEWNSRHFKLNCAHVRR